jgi:hypothetical protein
MKITEIAQIFGILSSTVKSYVLISTKNILDYILGEYLSNSSGHPGCEERRSELAAIPLNVHLNLTNVHFGGSGGCSVFLFLYLYFSGQEPQLGSVDYFNPESNKSRHLPCG